MLRLSFLLLLCSAAATPAMANVGPPIAYSTQTEVYLVNPDGTGKIRLYRSRSNNYISSVSLKPGGGQIAFVEDWIVKFMDFDAAGRQLGPIRSVVPSCFRLGNARYHPDGTSVLYQEACGNKTEIKQISVPSAANPNPVPTVLFSEDASDQGLFEATWDPSGTAIFYSLAAATQNELRRRYSDGTDQLIAASRSEQFRYPDVSPDGTRVVVSNYALGTTLGVGYSREVTIADGSSTPSFKGQYGRYAPDGRLYFIDYVSYNQRFIRYREPNGLAGQIGGKAVYWSVDVRR